MKEKTKRFVVAGVGGFIGAILGTSAGSATVWINLLVGAVGAVVVVFLINGFFGE